MARASKLGPGEPLVGAFEAAFVALWARAHQTLGDVTLTAIVDRVLYVTAERHPACSGLELGGTGVRWEAFRERAKSLPEAELVEGVRFALLEFLSVLGALTGEVLTPPLHAELDREAARLTLGEAGRGPSGAEAVEDTKP